MKSIWLCIILAGIIALLIIIPHMFITNTTKEMQNVLKKADTALEQENWDKATHLCTKAADMWEEYSTWYEMVTEHGEIDQITRSLRQLESFTKERECPEARAIIAELDFLINHLEETDNLSAENIF